MTKEFNLSKKIYIQNTNDGYFIYVKDIKEFIKRLKEEFKTPYGTIETTTKDVYDIIDKLAGEKLI